MNKTTKYLLIPIILTIYEPILMQPQKLVASLMDQHG